MILIEVLYKIKEDLKTLFNYYPFIDCPCGHGIDYDKYWEKRGRNIQSTLSDWQKERAEIVLQTIEKGSTCLDLGCGDGALIKYLWEKANIKGMGVDFSDKILKQANLLGIQVIKMDLSNLDNVQSLPVVDYIIGFEIIEHMAYPEDLLLCLQKKARKAMFFSIPNTGYYKHRLRLFFGKFPLQWINHPGEHLRFWTVADIKWWLNVLGFKIEKLYLYEGVPFLNRLFPSLFAQGILFKIIK